MKKVILLLIFANFIIISSFSARAELQCTIADTCATGIVPFSLYTIDAPGGSHAAIGDIYQHKVCCSGVYNLGTDCSGNYQTVVKLYAAENSHAAKSTVTDPGLTNVCLSAGSNQIECTYVDGQTCEQAGYQTCLATIAQESNSHLSDCDSNPFNTKICCRVIGCPDSFRECTEGTNCTCEGSSWACDTDVNQTCLNTYDPVAGACTACEPPQCGRSSFLECTGERDCDANGADRGDGCYQGYYFDFTNCTMDCSGCGDAECTTADCCLGLPEPCWCDCGLEPFADDTDGDGYDDICDQFPDDPCSRDIKADNCAAPECLATHDGDRDTIPDACDTENTLADCNDGMDNDGDGFCDDFGCAECDDTNYYCGTDDPGTPPLNLDPKCGAELCTACDQCGAGWLNFCSQDECEISCGTNCHYDAGLEFIPGLEFILNGCCLDSDSDTVCDEVDICDGPDGPDTDGDGTPDGCDLCPNEAALTSPSEIDEISCGDGIDNDCDDATDVDDDDCGCPRGMVRCDDGNCHTECILNLPCIDNDICESTESCNCRDCKYKQDGCQAGLVCDPGTQVCSDEPDLSALLCGPPCLTDHQTNCWAPEIPEGTVTGTTRCCGDDFEETWNFRSNVILEDLLVEYTCYKGKWRSLRDVDVIYDVSLE
ncbi:hypothetical protein KY360_05845 [Candidatus Woesearchaeota archaeon]|nr:hypothetical protein [Candidatus Woesearchaeota archaeon]